MIPEPGRGRIHLLGICGAGMASFAGMLKERGFTVTGSDQNVYPPMSEMLARLKVEVRSPYRAENLPREADLVVVGNAISRGNPELEEVLDRGLPYASMAEAVKELFIRGSRSVVVAGTHGKTTTSSLIAWLLAAAGRDPSFLVGGLPLNFDCGYRLGRGGVFVIEGDEYDTAYFDKGPKFLHYLPDTVVLGNVEYDHADIYPDLPAVTTAFRRLVNLIPRRGLLVVGSESPIAEDVARHALCPVETFSVTGEAFWRLSLDRVDERGSRFQVLRDGAAYVEAEGPFWGEAMLRNVLSAVAACRWLGMSGKEIAEGLAGFLGVRRRLEVRGEPAGVTVVDDFAHHPTAIQETLRAAALRWKGRRRWAVFEPRSFTARSNVFQDDLPDAFGAADRVVVAPVFSSSRLPADHELVEEKVVSDIRESGIEAWFLPSVDEIVRFLSTSLSEGDVVIGMSNGGFGGFHEKLLAALESTERRHP